MSYFRHYVVSLTTGAVVCVICWRVTGRMVHEIQRLTGVVVELQSEVAQLKEKVDNLKSRKRRGPGSGFFSIAGSSVEDEDDVYEEAYGGSNTNDFDSFQELQEDGSRITGVDKHGDSSSIDELFELIDMLLEGGDSDKQKAFEILQRNKHKYPSDAEFFWRLAKTTFQVSQVVGSDGDLEKKKQYVYDSKEHAEKALLLDDQCANAHKWVAITVGSIGEYEDTKQKIQNGFVYKEHIEKAIEINPTDPSNHYLLGRWCYSVYMLSWLERKAAAALFASPPTAKVEDALSHFLKADELNPAKWKDNILFISKCYIEMRQYKEAVKWLTIGHQIPIVSSDDKESQNEIVTLLSKYRGY